MLLKTHPACNSLTSSRKSNNERAQWRSKCRQKLSDHIYANIGLSIEPAQVRLITTGDDPYTWKVLPGKEHLFAKQMSKHSIGLYMELFREVGHSFEAVIATSKVTIEDQGNDGGATFSGKIAELERHNSSLMQELCKAESRDERAQREIVQLKAMILVLEQQDAQKTDFINQYRNITVKCMEDSNSAFKKYRLSAIANKADRGWSGRVGNAYTGCLADEEMPLD